MSLKVKIFIAVILGILILFCTLPLKTYTYIHDNIVEKFNTSILISPEIKPKEKEHYKVTVEKKEDSLFYSKYEEILEPNTYFINYMGYYTDTYRYGDKFSLFVPEKEHYVFKGWVLDKNNSTTITELGENFSGNITLWPKFEKEIYTISYDLNGGTLKDTPNTYEAFDKVDFLIPTKSGNKFIGWKYKDTYITSTENLFENLELEAIWEELPKIEENKQKTIKSETPKSNESKIDLSVDKIYVGNFSANVYQEDGTLQRIVDRVNSALIFSIDDIPRMLADHQYQGFSEIGTNNKSILVFGGDRYNLQKISQEYGYFADNKDGYQRVFLNRTGKPLSAADLPKDTFIVMYTCKGSGAIVTYWKIV